LAVILMGQKNYWNHPALFDYNDRYTGMNVGTGNWKDAMWTQLRGSYGCYWTKDNAADLYSQGHYNCAGQNVRCSSQNTNVGTLVTSCSQYPNSRACDYDPCNLGCNRSCGTVGSSSLKGSFWDLIGKILDWIKSIFMRGS
jgi:hypothetical protein